MQYGIALLGIDGCNSHFRCDIRIWCVSDGNSVVLDFRHSVTRNKHAILIALLFTELGLLITSCFHLA
jgi:hypothetical protein